MGDAGKGKDVFKKMCDQCHTANKGGKVKIGPNLFGIFGKTCGCKSKPCMNIKSFLKHQLSDILIK